MKAFIMVLLCTFSTIASATKYYVSSSTGNDGWDGLSAATAWKSISKVNSVSFVPGDVVAFMKGDEWRETLTIPSSGISGNFITFTSYGTGINPRFLGSSNAISWTQISPNIWKSATQFSTNPYTSYSSEIFFENSDGSESWGTYKSGTANLTSEYNWTWVTNNIYVFSASDPGAKYKSVEIPQRESTVNMNKKNYIHFDGIDMFYTYHSGYGYNYTHNDMYEQFGLIIENSEIGYIGAWDASLETGYGIEVVYTDMVVSKNKIHDCGRRGFAMDIYGNGFTARNILVEDNEFYNGFHTTGLDIDAGAGYNGNLDNITIRRNLFHEISQSRNTDLSNLIFIQNNAVGTCTITNIFIYDNIFKWQNGYGILMEGIQSVYIYNNVFFEKTTSCPNWASFIAAQSNSHAVANNNIFYGGSSGSSIDALDLSSTYFSHDYNLFFSTLSETETHGIISKNPMFADPVSNNFHLLSGSPAIGAGTPIPQVTTDYDGVAFGTPPDLGCFSSGTVIQNPIYSSSVIENATPSQLTMTYNQTLANIVPAPSAFTVQVNSVNRAVGSVAIVSGKVQLTLSTPVIFGDVITVAYTKPATNPLQTTTGGQAASIAAQPVTNNLVSASPVYVSSSIENATPSLLTMTYNLTLANNVPATSAFTVQVNSVNRAVGSVAIVSGKVQLTLSTPVIFGDVITVAYTKPATNPLQTTTGGQAASITAQPVTNNLVSASPVYVSSSIENATPSLLTMTYNLTLANIVPASSAFTVQVNSANRAVGSVAIVSGKVQLTLSTPVIFGDVITVAYTKPTTNPLQTTTGGLAASITAQPVTNNLVSASPVYVSSSIENATPSLLTMTYNQTLANIVPASSAFTVQVNSVNRAVGSVAIVSGKVQLTLSTPVIFGDVITVAYTKPATNPLQTTAGGQAASITAQPVTNNLLSASPVYVSSSIENATPSLLTMTYNQTLANIVPASSAFTVQVNSVNRAVGSVAIVSGKVQLTLLLPVIFSDVVTISYTKPATNPLQTTTGGQAATIYSKEVTNNINFINTPPNIVVNYNKSVYSGFVGEIDASLSYDANNDPLKYDWIVPDNMEVNSTAGQKIQFLAPIVKYSKTVNFILNLSDGFSTQTKSLTVTILPYRSRYMRLRTPRIISNNSKSDDNPYNLIDDNTETSWLSNGSDQWLIFELDHPIEINYIEAAFQKNKNSVARFDVWASADNVVWEPLLIDASSSSFAEGYQIFDIPDTKSSTKYSYVKLINHGNPESIAISISEFALFGTPDLGEFILNLYPNPAKTNVNVEIIGPDSGLSGNTGISNGIIRIYSTNSELVYEKLLDPDVSTFLLPLNLKSGTYIMNLISNGSTIAVRKLLILN
jgi:uncharacterized repeat protein (TIGR02059 family)